MFARQPVPQDFKLPPVKPTYKYPKVYRVTLNSADRISGTISNATFKVNLPVSVKDYKCMMFVEFFAFNDESNSSLTNLDRYFYNIHLRELSQPNTYYTKTSNITNIILTAKGRYHASYPTTDTLGFPMTNKTMFENNTINIYFSSDAITDGILASQQWTMVLVIHEHDYDCD
jgi:hypothetical protein